MGGPARYFQAVTSEAELSCAIDWARRHELPVRVLGGGSNVVVADTGFDGLVIQIALRGIDEDTGGELRVAAGESWHDFVMGQVRRGHQGIECLAGIPGLVGATPIQNVGAYGQEVSEVITRVVALEVKSSKLYTFEPRELDFGYRSSRFKQATPGEFIVTRVDFRLRPGGAPSLRYHDLQREAARLNQRGSAPSLSEVTSIVLRLRQQKSMLLDASDENARSCGSFFVNPCVPRHTLETIERSVAESVPHYPQADGTLKLPAAWLIERAGLSRGTRRGPVGISTRHTLALVCHEGATARHIVNFAHEVRQHVEQRFGVRLTPEPVFWGFADLDGGLPSPSS